MSELVAHTPATPGGAWHLLGDHLRVVGDLAGEFAAPFGGRELACLAGYMHDAGKAVDEVQQRFRVLGFQDGRSRERLGVPHKVEGAMILPILLRGRHRALGLAGYLMNHGHHSGIPAQADSATGADLRAVLRQPELLSPLTTLIQDLVGRDLDALVNASVLPAHVAVGVEVGDLSGLELFTRMCHSALVDADFLDTAAHFGGGQPWRSTAYGMAAWLHRFQQHYSARCVSVQ